MIALRPAQHRMLCALERADQNGLQLHKLTIVERMSTITLALLGLAEITAETPQRAVITTMGAAHRYRVAT